MNIFFVKFFMAFILAPQSGFRFLLTYFTILTPLHVFCKIKMHCTVCLAKLQLFKFYSFVL